MLGESSPTSRPGVTGKEETTMVSVEVVVVAFNCPTEMLDACVSSALAEQTDSVSVSVCIVDNASSAPVRHCDGNGRIMRNEQNLGFGRAVNQAVRTSTKDYVLMLNPDATLAQGALARALSAHDDTTISVLMLMKGDEVQLDAYTPWFFSLERQVRRRTLAGKLSKPNTEPVEVRKACGGALLASVGLLQQFGPFDERYFLYGEDFDFSLRFRGSGKRIFLQRGSIVHHTAAYSAKSHGELVERARADAAVRLGSYHLPRILSLAQRVELFIVTIFGVLVGGRASKRSIRLCRLKELRRWGLARDCPAFDPRHL
ncbi:glycosyltransferase [Nocardioides nanhaiensis]|uniref:glycosyltransferase n=1 Tax=Nocardioides nanhaiensis TaxID=1476871 RepID=UPI0031EBA43D